MAKRKSLLQKAPLLLVPQRLFNEDEKEIYLSELVLDEAVDEVQSDQLKPLKINAVYTLEKAVIDILKNRFPKARFYNPATPFLLGSHQLDQNSEEESAVFLCIQKDTFQVALLQKGELPLLQQF